MLFLIVNNKCNNIIIMYKKLLNLYILIKVYIKYCFVVPNFNYPD